MKISEIAERHGVSRQAVSRRVARFTAVHPDFRVSRDSRGWIVDVPLDQYEALIARYGDSALRPRLSASAEASGDMPEVVRSIDKAKLITAQVRAEREALKLAQERGKLVRVDLIGEAIERAEAVILAAIDRLPRHAEELSSALGRDGVQGLRQALARLARSIRHDIADALDGADGPGAV